MNKNTVRELNQQIFELIELCIHNERLFGDKAPTVDSPEEAWQLQRELYNKQKAIAKLLDVEALDMKAHTQQKWYKGQMTASIAEKQITRVTHLWILCCQEEEYPDRKGKKNIYSAQRGISTT